VNFSQHFRARVAILVGCGLASVTAAGYARAQELRVHANAGVIHAVGDPQQSEYGFGGGGAVAGELAIGKVIGLQAELSALALSQGSPPSDPRFAQQGTGTAFAAMLGPRLRPFGASQVAGLWLDVNGGITATGSLARPTLDAHVGYDWRVGKGRLDVGPFVGFTEIFQPSDTLRPEDAHLLWVGVHIALGAKGERGDRDRDSVYDDEDACPDVPGIRTADPKTNGCPQGDRDHDSIFDDEDACPDVPGIRTADPKTNGCPRSDRDHDGIFDDEDACPDVPGIRTGDPKTNGCPKSDRDNDTVFDDEDACPDVPGVRTSDPKTNGCPPAGDKVRMEGDKIILDDIIHFELDSPRVPRPNWPIVKKVADFILANPDVLEIDIEGHADETGTDEHNLILSRNRAASVKKLLVQDGVDEKRITTHAYGETRPKVPGHAEDQLRQNRRVEFTVTRSRAKPQELTPMSPPPAQGPTPNVPPSPSTPGTKP
jgi:OOP family OmpA-OmpF porin